MISFVNHYNYHTDAYDLGIYNNSIFQYSHYFNNHHPLGHESVTNFLGDHFSLYTIFFSPLCFLFGTYTLLIVQIATIIIGGLGVYKLVKKWHPDSFLPDAALFHFLAFYGILSAMAAEYHDNVVASMVVPWLIYFLNEGRLKPAAFMAVLICVGKENMPLWLFCICIGLALVYWKDKRKRLFALVTGFSALIYAVIIIKVVMPSMVKQEYQHAHLTYSILGSTPGEVLINLFTKTRYIFTAIFTNVTPYNYFDGIKGETFMCLLLSGGLGLLIRPEYLIMVLPIIAQKMFNDDMTKWGINSHYSIEFVPIVVIAFYSSLMYFKGARFKIAISLFFCLLTYSTTFCKMYNRKSQWYSEGLGSLFSEHHYFSFFNKTDVENTISKIPDNASLSALSCFVPHVAFRKEIYMFPDIHTADYIFVAETPRAYPLQGDALHNELMKYKNSPDWEIVSEINGIYLFHKKH